MSAPVRGRALTPDGVDPSAETGDVRSARSMGAPEIDPGIERRWDRVWWGDVPRIGRNPKKHPTWTRHRSTHRPVHALDARRVVRLEHRRDSAGCGSRPAQGEQAHRDGVVACQGIEVPRGPLVEGSGRRARARLTAPCAASNDPSARERHAGPPRLRRRCKHWRISRSSGAGDSRGSTSYSAAGSRVQIASPSRRRRGSTRSTRARVGGTTEDILRTDRRTVRGIDGAVAWTRRLVGVAGGRSGAGSVLLAGFSQDAGLALAAEDRRSWSPHWGGVSLRGYLPGGTTGGRRLGDGGGDSREPRAVPPPS